MSERQTADVRGICRTYHRDPGRLIDIVRDVQAQSGCVAGATIDAIARELGVHRVEVESTVSFYAFLSQEPQGRVVIRLCDDIIDEMNGSAGVAEAFREELGIDFGETTPDGKITLEWTPCIGMCDQAPAALVNDVVFPNLSREVARTIVRGLREHLMPQRLIQHYGDGNNAHDLVQSAVSNNIRQQGPVVFAPMPAGEAIRLALAMNPVEVIRQVKTSRLRGRGGAGFPTGMKWEFTRNAAGGQRYLLCNADEGEPGTFKDRVILTERSDLLFEGMTIAGYAIGADTGILYLRAEYAYLRRFLEHMLQERRRQELLGKGICGHEGFDFDIRIQMGAGAYVCGEETALINSCEGFRGDPRNRPPFPAQEGYRGCPTSVNNVETLCCAARILQKGASWFAQLGSSGSTGTKLLSVSGDCMRPGIYEVPFGIKIAEVLDLCGAPEAHAVQIGGPSGQMLGQDGFGRTICYDDVATGGAFMIFGRERDVVYIAAKFLDFFVEESCGYCTPCRVGNVLLKDSLDRILGGRGEPRDLDLLQRLGKTVKACSRCGLGQTSPNPVLTTLEHFRGEYEARLQMPTNGRRASFDIQAALTEATRITSRSRGER